MNQIIKGRLSKWIIIVVAIGLFIQPVQQVLAAESGNGTTSVGAGVEQSAPVEMIDKTSDSSENTEEESGEDAQVEEPTDDESMKDEVFSCLLQQ